MFSCTRSAQVIHCEPFTLEPNASRKIDIAFSPDFTMSKVQQELAIVSDVGGVEQRLVYTLQATIPSALLAACSTAIPRPSWEPLLYYTVLTLLVIMLGATLLIAMMDSDILIKESINTVTSYQTPQHLDKDKVFDLKAIGVRDTNKKLVATPNNIYVNGQVSVDFPHQRNITKVSNSNGNILNHSNKKGSTNLINNNSNNILNGKYRPPKYNDGRSDVQSFNGNNSNRSESGSKRRLVSEAGVAVLEYLRVCGTSLWRAVVGPVARDTSRLKKRSSSSKHRDSSSGQRMQRDVIQTSFAAAASSNNNNIINNRNGNIDPMSYSQADKPRQPGPDKLSKYNKAPRVDKEYKTKEKTNRHNSVDRRISKDCNYSIQEYNSDEYRSLAYKPSHKNSEQEEETSSYTTESSNTEDISASDKV